MMRKIFLVLINLVITNFIFAQLLEEKVAVMTAAQKPPIVKRLRFSNESGLAGALFICPFRQYPVRARVVAGVAAGETFQIILMFRLGLPEVANRREFGGYFSRPQIRGIDVGNRVERRLLLGVINVINRRTIRRASIITLPVGGGGVMYLEKQF